MLPAASVPTRTRCEPTMPETFETLTATRPAEARALLDTLDSPPASGHDADTLATVQLDRWTLHFDEPRVEAAFIRSHLAATLPFIRWVAVVVAVFCIVLWLSVLVAFSEVPGLAGFISRVGVATCLAMVGLGAWSYRPSFARHLQPITCRRRSVRHCSTWPW